MSDEKGCDRRGFIGGVLGSIAGLLSRRPSSAGNDLVATAERLRPRGYLEDTSLDLARDYDRDCALSGPSARIGLQAVAPGHYRWGNPSVSSRAVRPPGDEAPEVTYVISTSDVVS